MYQRTRKPRVLIALLLALSLMLCLGATQVAADVAVESTVVVDTQIQEYRRFVQYEYGVDLPDDLTFQFIVGLFGEWTGDDLAVEDGLEERSAAQAVLMSVKAAQLEELALTYDDEQIAHALLSVDLTLEADPEVLQAVATAIDYAMLPLELVTGVDLNDPVSDDLAIYLMGKVIEMNGLYKRSIGRVSDADIVAKLQAAWDAQSIIDAPELREQVNAILEADTITGYNLKDKDFDARFDPALSLIYGHSDITNAVQLLGLLRREGIDARIQLEPKSSAYKHMADWGDPEASSSTNIQQIENGNWIVTSKEYDLVFEFVTVEEKEAFDGIVLQYAKRNEEDRTGLIRSSWWQPLYYTYEPFGKYIPVTNNLIEADGKIAQTFSLPEDFETVAAAFEDLGSMSTYHNLYVNQAFFNYLMGESS